MANIDHLIGKQFNEILILEDLGNKRNSQRYVKIKCSCGKIKPMRLSSILNGHSKSCHGRKLPKGKSASRRVYKKYKKRRSEDFELSFEQFYELTQLVCHYCGKPPLNICKSNNGNFVYNGLDRMDNSKGYILENVCPCCKICNEMKLDHSLFTFYNQIFAIARHGVKYRKDLLIHLGIDFRV